MTEGANFKVTLVDGVSPAAKPAAQALGGLETRLGAVDRDLKSAAKAANSFANALAGVKSKSTGSFGMQAWGAGARVSGPAGWRQTTQAIQQAERAVQGATSSAGGLRAGLNGVGGAALGAAAAVAGIAAAAAGVGVRLGASFLELVRFREQAVVTMGVLMGGRGRTGAGSVRAVGTAAFNQARQLAQQTPAETTDVIRLQQEVAQGGFRGGDRERAMAAALDVQALRGTEASSLFLRGLSQVSNRSRLMIQDLRQATDAVGLNEQATLRRAAQLAGIVQRQGEADTAYQRRVEQAISQGRVTGEQGRQAILGQLQETTGSRLGGFAAASAGTLGGALSNMSSAFTDLILGINNLENLPGVQAFAGFARDFASALSGASAEGRQIQGIISEIANTVGTELFGRVNAGSVIRNVLGLVRQAVPVVMALFRGFKAFVSGFGSGFMAGIRPLLDLFSQLSTTGDGGVSTLQSLGRAIGWIVSMGVQGIVVATGALLGFWELLRRLWAFLIALPQGLANYFSTLGGLFSGAGAAIVDGLVSGLTGAWGRLTGTLTQLASALPGPVRSALGIASPSKVFADLGRQLPAGLALGIEEGSPVAQGAAEALVSPPEAPRGVGAGASITVQVNVDGAGAGTPQDLGDAVAAAVEQVLVDLFGRVALAGGA